MIKPNVNKNDIHVALKYIDEHGVPARSQSRTYNLVNDDGITYPAKYVVNLADYLANGVSIASADYNY